MKIDIPIIDKNQLIQHLENGCKTKDNWAIGTENEQFIFQVPELQRTEYEGPRGIKAILDRFAHEGWKPIVELGNTIALNHNKANISLEPAGQFELSGAPLKNLHDSFSELNAYNQHLYKHLKKLDLAMLSQGLDPKTARKNMPWMPKQRYKIMREYMPTKGRHGLDMMTATATVQTNLDYSSESDLAKKFRTSMAIQPVITGLFANSPIHEGKLSGFKSFRGHIWTDTDPDRSGLLSFAFDENFTFEKYIDYILNVPMYFVYRKGIYHNHAGQSFKDYMNKKLPGFEGNLPTMSDFEDHLTTAFPEVRIKQFIEMRGADSGSPEHIEALSALWTGLLYDQSALDELYETTKSWTIEECQKLKTDVLKHGLDAPFKGQPLFVTARIIVDLAKQGLKNRAIINKKGQDESVYLGYLEDLVERKICPADLLIKSFVEDCDQNVDTYLHHHLHTGT